MELNIKEPLRSRLEVALEACWRAGKITLEYFQTGVPVELKSDQTPVTIADRRAEEEIRGWLTRYFPDDAIVGEEGGSTTPARNTNTTWYIDPIDGTKAFICGVPFYGALLACEMQGRVVLGVAHFPALGETVWAAQNAGCYWNGRRARVSAVTKMDEAVLLTTDFFRMETMGYDAALERLCRSTKLQRTWGDAYGHILVATGRAEIMLDPRMAVWDNGPLLPILEEAGGRFTDWQGNATIHGENAFSTNGHLHEAVEQMLPPKS
ncbi:MAG: Histidinol-phosphatase [bacterium]|nr:Histidinol-phosphatase [bacterium]